MKNNISPPYLSICLAICLLSPLSLSAQKRYYVKTNGSSSLTGSSWGWALNSIQAASEKAVAGDTIYVAVGTYYGGFTMKEGVSLKGGYTANIQKPNERYNVLETDDPSKHTILDGSLNQRVLMQYVPFSKTTTWEGFVIRNGKPSTEWKIGTIIYSQEGETQIVGVLYQYDSDSDQGMIFGVEEVKKQWGGYRTDLPLPIAGTKEMAANDMQGESHANTIIEELAGQSLDFREAATVYNANYAAYWCDTLTAGGYREWYLPSAGELHTIFQSGIQPILLSLGKKLNSGYWSGSHAGDLLAWSYNLQAGHFHPSLKYADRLVSAVHPFRAPADPNPIYTAGGGAFIKENGILQGCIIKENQSPTQGGGVYVAKGGALLNCLVGGNMAPEGKEVYYEESGSGTIALKAEKLTVYPNRVEGGGSLRVKVPGASAETTSFRFLNYTGTSVKNGILTADDSSIEAPSLPGVYLLLIQNSTQTTLTSKIVVYSK